MLSGGVGVGGNENGDDGDDDGVGGNEDGDRDKHIKCGKPVV